MNILFNSFYKLEVDVFHSPEKDMFQLVIAKTPLPDDEHPPAFLPNRQEYFFNTEQMRQLMTYLNGATLGKI